MSKSLTTMTAEVQARIGDAAAAIWTAAEISRYVKEGYGQMAILTEYYWKSAQLDDVADQALYTLPTDFLKMQRVTWDNRRIDPLTSMQLENFDHQYHTATGNPTGYTMDKDGITKLRKVPIPSASATGATVNTKIQYIRRAVALASGATTLEFPDVYSNYIRHYACYRCFDREGKGQDLKMADFWKELWENGIQRMIRRNNRFHSRHITVIGGGSEPRLRPPLARLPWRYGRVVR